MQFLQRLDETEARFDELTRQMADPDVISNADVYRKTAKSRNDLADLVEKYREWKKASSDLEGARAMLTETDAELRAMAAEDVARLEPEVTKFEDELRLLLLPKDPNDDTDVILEIRAGTGGDEATLFAAEVFRMYCRYA